MRLINLYKFINKFIIGKNPDVWFLFRFSPRCQFLLLGMKFVPDVRFQKSSVPDVTSHKLPRCVVPNRPVPDVMFYTYRGPCTLEWPINFPGSATHLKPLQQHNNTPLSSKEEPPSSYLSFDTKLGSFLGHNLVRKRESSTTCVSLASRLNFDL